MIDPFIDGDSNKVECASCGSIAEFTDNTDEGDGFGQDYYFCSDCDKNTVLHYQKVYEEPYCVEDELQEQSAK